MRLASFFDRRTGQLYTIDLDWTDREGERAAREQVALEGVDVEEAEREAWLEWYGTTV